MSEVAAHFHRIVKWARTHQPLLAERLSAPAAPGDLAAAEAEIGQALTQDLRALYNVADGQMDFDGNAPGLESESLIDGFFFGMPFYPLGEALKERRYRLGQIDQPWGFHPDAASIPPDAVKPTVFNAGWLPISHDYGGNCLTIDMNPDRHGVAGQVILIGPDEEPYCRVADSLADFLGWIAAELEAGHWSLSEEGLQWIHPQGSHLHAALRDVVIAQGGLPIRAR